MNEYNALKDAIRAAIKPNGEYALTAQVLQNILIAIVNSFGKGYQFMGIATAETEPGEPDEKEFYVGFAGVYANFGSETVTVPVGGVVIFLYDTEWHANVVKVAERVAVSGNHLEIDGARSIIEQDIVNVNTLTSQGEAFLTAAAARAAVSAESGLRIGGQVITYLVETDEEHHTAWVVDQFTGDDAEGWENDDNWQPFLYVELAKIVSNQAQINEAIMEALGNRYTKEQVDGMIEPLSERMGAAEEGLAAEILRAQAAESRLQDMYEGLTQNPVVIGPLPSSGQANTIYRVPGTSSYSDYMWDGTQFVLMATYSDGRLDFINVNLLNATDSTPHAAYASAAAARADITAASGLRALGLQITYLLTDGVWYTDQYIGTDISGWTDASNWKTLGPVTATQNSETGEKELNIGEEKVLVVEKEPKLNSKDPVSSGGVAELINGLEDSFYIIDKNRNIALILDADGLKVKKIILIDNGQTRTIDSTYIDLINALINNCQGIQEDNLGDYKVADENRNIVFALTKKGLEYAKQVFHGENGKVYIIDEYNQISFCIKENGESSLVIDKDSFVKAFNKYKQYLNISIESENVYNGIKYRTLDNPIGLVNFGHTFASIIHHWGFIGDSLSSGLFYLWQNGVGRIATNYGYSYGQRMVKLLNAEGINWSISGWTTKMWCNTFWAQEQNGYTENDYNLWDGSHPLTPTGTKFKDDPKQAYIIELGANDGVDPESAEGYKHLDPGNVETDIYDPSDPSTFAQNADTYAGWYAGIIQRIKTIAPSAKIFVMTLFPAFSDRTPYDNIVRQMPGIFRNVYLLDLKKYFVNSSAFQNACWEGGHFRPLGYQYVAYAVATYIDNIIREHPNDFKWMPFINTSVDEGNF